MSDKGPCEDVGCRCLGGMGRRDFIKLAAAGTAAIAARSMPVSAGSPEDENEYLKLIPADKRLDPAWVKSLSLRGQPAVYHNDELRYIGMPVGGIGAGQVYLGGDGRLWLWDVFNRQHARGLLAKGAGGETYLKPLDQVHPFDQGFEIRVKAAGRTQTRTLDRKGFSDVSFQGRYPMATVTYRDADCPVEVTLEAFSPFVPLDLHNSDYPAVVLQYTLKNTGGEPVDVEIAGRTENPVCLHTGNSVDTRRRNRVLRREGVTILRCSAEEPAEKPSAADRPDVPFDDFERAAYETWTTEGTAFGDGPVEIKSIPSYQGDVAGRGRRVVNSHASAPGDDVREKDAKTGTLTSREFTIARRFITFLIGGGAHKDKTCLNLLVDGKVIRSAIGADHNRMRPDAFDVADLEGKTAKLQVVDAVSGPWGNVGIDHVVFSDRPSRKATPLSQRHDFGTLALALVGAADHATADRDHPEDADREDATAPFGRKLSGSLSRLLELAPGRRQTVTFVFAWHFPNLIMPGPFNRRMGRLYASRFAGADKAAEHVASHLEELHRQTRLWTDTWYDSTLPYWLLDRTMANTSTLATSTCYLFEDGRFYGWEGIACCPGTCAHVWHYAQAPGRLFPQIERDVRRRVDFGIALHEDGRIGYRGELHDHHADDGQCGRILGVLREHQTSPDDAFLKQLWPKVKRAIEFMIGRDDADDGILDGAQPNTLDAAWYGEISFTSSLYLAALRAGQTMAREMGDDDFARRCAAIAEKGAQSILKLFNGEYFIQIEDPAHRDKIGTGPGCYIDQVFGQTWAHWVGLGRLFDRDKQLRALRSLWKYNFVPDVGPFRKRFQQGRWYAAAGDAGLLMCTWPKGGQNPNFHKHWQYMYFNECMTGFEWQAAAHMIWEGHDQPDLLEHGLAIARAIHDRYNARLRNPYNEIECSDHYARAMASYGAYQAVCGFESHGPNGHVGFAPRLSPDDFRCAFTAAGGWGTFSQQRAPGQHTASLDLKWGSLRLQSIALDLREGFTPQQASVTLDDRKTSASLTIDGGRAVVALDDSVQVQAGQCLEVSLR